MLNISANQAKNRFGELLDNAQREPVTIEKHGRPVAVVLSTEDYEDLKQIKFERLRAEVQIGLDQIDRGEASELNEAKLAKLFDNIKAEGRKQI